MNIRLHFTFLLCCLLLTVSSFATDYFFVGNGDWMDAANWKDGLLPTGAADNVIYINGTARTSRNNGEYGSYTCSGSGCDYFFTNSGTIIVSLGGTLTLNNSTQFSNGGSITVIGTLINSTVFEAYSHGTVTVHGTLNNNHVFGNQGLVTINNGGAIENKANALFTNTGFGGFTFPTIGTLVINSGGMFNNSGTATLKAGNLTNNGTLDNQSFLTGNATVTGNLTNSGTLAPGNSPGMYTIHGDYSATTTAIHNFEVGGTASSSFDRLRAGGNVYLDGTLNVSLINGFVPSSGNPDLPIFTGTINGMFSTVNKPSHYELIYNSNSVVLRVATTLPVSISNVHVKKEGTGAKLTWTVQTEINTSHYEVEKSSNGKQFSKFGEVKSAYLGQYNFTDYDLGENNIFYRIKSVDKDRKYSYSIVIAYSKGKTTVPLSVFPSPARSSISIQHAGATAKDKIVIASMDGRMIQTIYPVNGAQKTTVDITNLSTGTYIVRLYNSNEQIGNSRFVKQ
ncbi:MAG TPA: T9SS type A sorting domain-containing protein [Flavisolibacter sp.]|jgi:hypothetical protein|nr:T9SS type A sorting domain-containing protein [Flavisolibacter sp.]